MEYENRSVLCLCVTTSHTAIILSPGVEEVRKRESEDKRMELDQWWCSSFTGVTSSQDSARWQWLDKCLFPISLFFLLITILTYVLLKWASVPSTDFPLSFTLLFPSLCSPLALLYSLFFSSKHRYGEEHNYCMSVVKMKWCPLLYPQLKVGCTSWNLPWSSLLRELFPPGECTNLPDYFLPAKLKDWTYVYLWANKTFCQTTV